MIGSYLDKQVTNVKNGVLAGASLLGLGLIIYFIIKKRKAIGASLGIGKKDKPSSVDIDKPKLIEDKSNDADTTEDEVVDIETDEDEDEINDAADDAGSNTKDN